MLPFLKWAGGKDKELKFIIPALPDNYVDFYEPFVGGGSVFAAVEARHYYINDLSTELTAFYRAVADDDQQFYRYAVMINNAWGDADRFYDRSALLKDLYQAFRCGDMSNDRLYAAVDDFCATRRDDIISILEPDIDHQPGVLVAELSKNLKRKLTRMKELEQRKHALPDDDVCDNIRTAVKSALYMYFRCLYNDHAIADTALKTALFLFIRNYCYSGMFRYNDNGDFNVPYGGMAYNNKMLDRKFEYYRSAQVASRFADTTVTNLDFEEFFGRFAPTADDFVFLDPPYDSEFSTYARNEFNRADHLRLANYLVNRCQARWMLVIKNTDFIYHLYDHPAINIRSFDKKYQVSFMNRNDRSAEHLLITNY